MSIWSKIFHSDKKDSKIVIAVAVADDLKIFKSIDEAILFLKKNNNNKSIQGLERLRKSISGDKKVKAVRITEDNEIIEYDDLEEMKKTPQS